MRARELIAEEWESYAMDVIPKNAPPVQMTETRRAFCAGAGSLLGILVRGLEPGEQPTQQDLGLLERIQAELKAFHARVASGKA
jgi:hypothetical protein